MHMWIGLAQEKIFWDFFTKVFTPDLGQIEYNCDKIDFIIHQQDQIRCKL